MFSDKDFQSLIPDEGIRNYIVEGLGSNPFNNNLDYYTIFNNIINLAFMYAFSCYTDLRNRNISIGNNVGILDKCIRNGNANSLRVIRTMEKIYKSYPITNELIQFVLLDIRFDFILGEESRLMDYFPNCFAVKSFQLSEYFSMVNLSMVSSRLEQYDLATLEDKLRELISIFPFLGKTALKYSERTGWYTFEIKKNRIYTDGQINTYGLIHRIKTGKRSRFYYLATLDKNVLRYENFRDSKNCLAVGNDAPPTTQVFTSPYHLSWDEEAVYTYLVHDFSNENDVPVKKAKIDQLFNINYKHIKNLALAISDSLGREPFKKCGEALISAFGDLYPDILASYQKENCNWDPIIVMLLIEASPSRVLKVIFQHNSEIAYVILRNLKHRFGAEFSAKLQDIQSNNDFTEQAERLIEFNQLHLGNKPIRTQTYESIYAELLAEAKTTILLSALSNIRAEKAYSYAGNIGQGVESLQSLPSDISPEELCQAIQSTFGVVLKRITCFYAGIFAYGKKKLEYDKKSELRFLPLNEIKKYQDACKKDFAAAVEKKWQELTEKDNGDSILAILKNFIELCNRCKDASSGSLYGRSDESRYLYTVLGKYFIMDMDIFEREIDVTAVEDLSADTAHWWLEKSIRLMRFFATGDFEQTNDYMLYFQHAIAPVIASYNSFNSSKDGYDTAVFYLTIDVDGNNVADYHREINVLSEFSYDMHTQYYCLPNIVRANEKWWIDPFVIECKIIDEICTRK